MKPHEEWLYKAENDLESAKYLITADKRLYDIIVYHSQQCAEKSLKAFLVSTDRKIEKTHSLIILTEQCESLRPEFSALRTAVSFLNPYSTVYRYPMDLLLPSLKETKEAIMHAESVYQFIKDVLEE